MKKLIFSYLLSVIACQIMAQDDDMYFASDGSQKAQKVGNSVSSSNNSGGYKSYRPYEDNYSYNPKDYCGSDRDVDEYNRRYRYGNDPYYNKDSVTISINDFENYMRLRRWEGYRPTTTVIVVDDPWYYDPWYYGSYYYDPWYYGWSWHYGYYSRPWYWGSSWGYYYSGWGWRGRGWYGRHWGYTPVRYGHYRRGGYPTTYSARRSGWTSNYGTGRNDTHRRSYISTSNRSNYGRIGNSTGGVRQSSGTTYNRSYGSTSTSSTRRSSSIPSGGMRNSGSVTRSSGGGFSGGGMRSSGVFSGGGGMRSSGGGFSGGGGRRR